jgi:hypothetical protein
MDYMECAIEHYEDRVKSLDCRIWEEKLLIKLKELKEKEVA